MTGVPVHTRSKNCLRSARGVRNPLGIATSKIRDVALTV
jgi:hypothetical protein